MKGKEKINALLEGFEDNEDALMFRALSESMDFQVMARILADTFGKEGSESLTDAITFEAREGRYEPRGT